MANKSIICPANGYKVNPANCSGKGKCDSCYEMVLKNKPAITFDNDNLIAGIPAVTKAIPPILNWSEPTVKNMYAQGIIPSEPREKHETHITNVNSLSLGITAEDLRGIQNIADCAGCSNKSVGRWIKKEDFPHIIVGGQYFSTQTSVHHFMNERNSKREKKRDSYTDPS